MRQYGLPVLPRQLRIDKEVANDLASTPNDAIIWTEILKSEIYLALKLNLYLNQTSSSLANSPLDQGNVFKIAINLHRLATSPK